jgi:serine/threonine protein kinase
MTAARLDNEAIFHAARDIADPDHRRAYVRQACGGDETRIAHVAALLAAADAPDSLLDQPLPERLAAALAKPEGGAETQGEPPDPDAGGEVLSFLTPSDKPGVLGRLGHYDILEVIGKGGMGVVLRAFDEKLHRVVAIKVMAAQLATSASARKRFTREAQAAAAVSHDHVVTIHAVEEANGLPYLVMQYVSGMSVQQRLERDGPLQLAEIVRIGMQTAAGLAAAHAQGLVHRDIKPANILLENGIERVKITDFGLARAAADASLTQSGVVAGTPQYMSPEQARGERPDERSDLFSLGSVLYALSTGRPPFRASDSMAVLKRVCEETPRPIRETNADIPDWLVALIDRLHAKNPADRYQTAAEVATLLSGYLAHLQHPSVVPLPVGPSKKQPKQHRRRWAIAFAMLICLVIGFSLLEATGVTRLRATVIGVFTPDGQDAGTTNGGGKPGNGGVEGLDFKVGEVRKHNWAGRRAYFAGFSPDGRYYVATGEIPQLPPGAGPCTVRVWELASGKLVLEVLGNEFALFTPDSKRLIAAGPDKQIHVWDLAARKQIAQFGEHPDWLRLSSLSADGKQLLTGCYDGIVRLWDVAEGKEIARLESEDKLGYPYLCPDGKQAITLDHPTNIIRLWDLAERKEIRRWQQPDPVYPFMAFLPGGQRFATYGPDTVYFWDMASEKETQSLRLVGKMVGLGFSPDGSRALYAVASDPLMRLVELPGGKELATFEMSKESVGSWIGLIAFSRDGRFAVAAHLTGVVHLWRLPDPPALGKK